MLSSRFLLNNGRCFSCATTNLGLTQGHPLLNSILYRSRCTLSLTVRSTSSFQQQKYSLLTQNQLVNSKQLYSSSTDIPPNNKDAATPPEPPPPPPRKPGLIRRLIRWIPLHPSYFEVFLTKARISDDPDLIRMLAKTLSFSLTALVAISTLGTLGVDTKPLVTGLGITGFTVGFALKEIATNYLAGFLLVLQRPFYHGAWLRVHAGGIVLEGKVTAIDVRYVCLESKEGGRVMIPSAVVYSNAIVVLSGDRFQAKNKL